MSVFSVGTSACEFRFDYLMNFNYVFVLWNEMYESEQNVWNDDKEMLKTNAEKTKKSNKKWNKFRKENRINMQISHKASLRLKVCEKMLK